MTASAADGAPATLRILSPGATEEEVAAVTAVLHSALDELAGGMSVEGEARVSAWQRSQRPVRSPLTPGAGSWRDFSG